MSTPSTPSTPFTMATVPRSIRHAIDGCSEYQRICSNFVSEHVYTCINVLVDRLREGGNFEDDLDELNAQPNYVEACEQNDIVLVEVDGYWFNFDWKDLTSIPVDVKDMKFGLDLKRFAADKGLQLQDWRWDAEASDPIHISDITADHTNIVNDGHILDTLAKETQYFDLGDSAQFLVDVARREGKTELADAITSGSKHKELFENYLTPDPDFALDPYDDETAAAEAACEAHNIEPDITEVSSYYHVSERLAYLLKKEGEVIADDFVGSLVVWGRTSGGQAIALDGVITTIVDKECIDELDALIRLKFPNLGADDQSLVGVPVDMLKAAEDARIRVLNFQVMEGWSNPRKAEAQKLLVLSPDSPDSGWLLSASEFNARRYAIVPGEKDGRNPGEAIPVATIYESLKAVDGIASSLPSADQVAKLATEIEVYHRANQSSSLHTVPADLDARLKAVSPEYASGQSKTSGPSLG